MRDRYPHTQTVSTRWRDNDVYGHINNAVYYSYMDSVINRYLIASGLDIHGGEVIAVAASSSCQFSAPVAFPAMIEAGMAVTELGRSSVHYEVAMFAGDAADPAAVGTFVHVFVDRDTRRPVPVPPPIRTALETLRVAD